MISFVLLKINNLNRGVCAWCLDDQHASPLILGIIYLKFMEIYLFIIKRHETEKKLSRRNFFISDILYNESFSAKGGGPFRERGALWHAPHLPLMAPQENNNKKISSCSFWKIRKEKKHAKWRNLFRKKKCFLTQWEKNFTFKFFNLRFAVVFFLIHT